MGTAIRLGLKFTEGFMVTVTARLYGDVRVRVGHVSAVLVLWGRCTGKMSGRGNCPEFHHEDVV